jgi:putative oxidoreductase
LIAGLVSRLIAVPFIIEMIVAILTTKISLYTRSDYAQLLTVAFLLVAGPGKRSLDALVQRRSGVERRSTVPKQLTLPEQPKSQSA